MMSILKKFTDEYTSIQILTIDISNRGKNSKENYFDMRKTYIRNEPFPKNAITVKIIRIVWTKPPANTINMHQQLDNRGI
jgi:hypothetical protein